MKDNGFKLTAERSRRYPAQTITDADYANDIRFWQIHPPKPKPFYIVRNEQRLALASMSMNTRRNTCALIKEATSPHKKVVL